ncbi:hypothetical protein [uncultured Aquimarina sp.]|uniref:hypothetical protein n=1 Tax=uncultured Aquimarina sp. TaxID=575652 RepID=UPI0026019BC2|nr:hypothetical protein [uncultured Aquimarina sp.]
MSIAAMVASIKFNDRRNKRDAFSHINGTTDAKSQGIKVEPVSEETLQEIRTKIQKQNRLTTIKIIAVFSIAIIATIWLLF